jgi:O-acetyl-ADP-ribose deacetylase (regulator of RNase III)
MVLLKIGYTVAAMIESVHGDLLQADAVALVNTVNTAGVMGKGVALQFKHAYPQNYKAYVEACKHQAVQIGQMLVVDLGLLSTPRYIINFPTKQHWRNPSKLEYIRLGLLDLVQQVKALGIPSIAIPPLGAGNGGLAWAEVRPLVVQAFSGLPEVRVLMFEPQPEMVHSLQAPPEKPKLTVGRAALIQLFALYTALGENIGRLEAQKLAYFLQASGLELCLPFVAHKFGPYADNLNHVLQRLEGSYLRGYQDRNTHSSLEVMAGALDEALVFLADHPQVKDAVSRALEWVTGFETPYGLELLATVHWAVHQLRVQDFAELPNALANWNERKASFEIGHLRAAWERVKSLSQTHTPMPIKI